MSVICPACAAVNRAGALHCKSCGGMLATEPLPAPAAASLAVPAALCPECQAPVRAGARFCGHCGCALAAATPAATLASFSPAPVLEPAPTPATVDTAPSQVPLVNLVAAAKPEPLLAVEAPAKPLNPPLAPTQPWVIDIDLPAPAAVAAPPVVDVVETAAMTTEATAAMPATDAVSATSTALPAAVVDAPAAASPRAESEAPRFTSLDSPKSPPTARPPAPQPDDAALTAEELEKEETAPAHRPVGLYAGVALAGVAVVGALAWWMLRDAPAVASVPAASPAAAAVTAAVTARTPDEEIITEPAEPAAPVAPEPPVTATPAAAPALETPAVVASAAPARPAPPRQRPAPGASNDPPWNHPGSRAPAPASLSGAGAAPVPAPPPVADAPVPPPDPLAPLHADLRQCDGESNILGKGVCVVRARHRHCGTHWGKVPECPLAQRSRDPYDN